MSWVMCELCSAVSQNARRVFDRRVSHQPAKEEEEDTSLPRRWRRRRRTPACQGGGEGACQMPTLTLLQFLHFIQEFFGKAMKIAIYRILDKPMCGIKLTFSAGAGRLVGCSQVPQPTCCCVDFQ